MDRTTHAQIVEILDRTEDMTVATIRPDGFPQATVVSFVHDDLTLYFGTSRHGQKAANIRRSDKVSATVTPPYESWDRIEGLSLGGHAREVTDAAEIERATGLLLARYPQAAAFAPEDASDLVLVRIDPVVISLLDYTQGFGHTEEIHVQAYLSPAG